ncbi:MAG: Xaa-Pro peptidase family protein [Fimbriimonadales bacterium]|nr:Xaa-Pro peptidase family protein [Fimbriimonadales bacterium]
MNNLQRLQRRLADLGLQAYLATDLADVRWLTGFTGSAGTVLVAADRACFFTDGRYTIQANEQVGELLPVRITTHDAPLAAQLATLTREWGLESIAFNGDVVTVNTHRQWCEKLEGVELRPVDDPCAALRMVKSPKEIAKIQEACRLTDAAFRHVLRLVQPGVAELDIHLELEFFLKRQGAGLAFEPIVVSGPRSALPHGKASERKLEVGDFVTMDFGARHDGYCADLTRTVVVGRADERQREIYEAVLAAQRAAIQALRAGAIGKDVDAAARSSLAEKGLERYFTHGLGHGLGAVVHDHGRLNQTSELRVEAAQVWTIEPGVYIEGFGGVRIEDDVLVTAEGPVILTESPKELLVLP